MMANAVVDHSHALSVLKKMKRTLKRHGPITSAVGILKRKHQSLTKIFGVEEMPIMPSSIDNLSASTKQDFPVPSDFPGNLQFYSPFHHPDVSEGASRVIVAQKALDHLEKNLAGFEQIFEEFHIKRSNYRLLAGFDEDVIRAGLGFLNQIHIFLLSEPPNITSFLSRLSPALEGFSAVVFMDKSTYHIPSTTRQATRQAHELPSCLSILSRDVGNGSFLTVGGPSGQSGQTNGRDGSRKGKEREDSEWNAPNDSGKGADGDADLESPVPDGDGPRSAQVSFRVISKLPEYDAARERNAPRPEPFQELQVKGIVKVKRTSESQDPRRFPTCEIEFTQFRTSFVPKPDKPTYHHFHLDVSIDAKERLTDIAKIRPDSTSKYNPELKVSHTSKKSWNMLASATLSIVNPQATIAASGSRAGEQSTATEKTSLVSRIIERDIGPKISWSFHITDPFNQETGLILSPEKLPRAHFDFRKKPPAPPPKHLDLEIRTFWSLLCGRAWLTLEGKPSFSNLCKVITLDLQSHLQGLHKYDRDLLVWPKNKNLGSTVTRLEFTDEEGLKDLVGANVVDTDNVPWVT